MVNSFFYFIYCKVNHNNPQCYYQQRDFCLELNIININLILKRTHYQ